MQTSDAKDVNLNCNTNALRFYNRVIGNAPTYHIPHYMLLSQNLHSQSVDVTYTDRAYKPFPLHCSLPLPFFCTHKSTNSNEDSGLEYIESKELWKKNIAIMKRAHRNRYGKRKYTQVVENSISEVTIPISLLNFTKLLEEDPDKYFDCHYNWYFSGNGNLCLAELNNRSFIVHASDCELYVSHYQQSEKERCKIKYSFENRQLIHETSLIEYSTHYLIGLRQKYNINLVNFKEDCDNLELKPLKTIKSKIPFTSFALDKSDKSVYYVDIQGALSFEDIESSHVTKVYSNTPNEVILNNWSSVQFVNSNILLQTNSRQIKIFDNREKYDTKDIFFVNDANCENITTSKISPNKNYNVYIGTLHSLYYCDLRFSKCNQPFIAKWTHGLKSPPLFLTTTMYRNQELVNLNSQLPTESCLILNSYYNHSNSPHDISNAFHEYTSDSLTCHHNKLTECYFPWHPKPIQETLKNAQMKGFCLDPTVNLKKRLNMSKTGALLKFKNNTNLNLYTLNSVGDVFYQLFKEDYIFDTDNYCEKLQLWADGLQTTKFPFVASSQINLTKYSTLLKGKQKYLSNIRKNIQKGLLPTKLQWKKSLTGLHEYADMYANELLGVWDISHGVEDLDHKFPPPPDTNFKIDLWMKDFLLNEENKV